MTAGLTTNAINQEPADAWAREAARVPIAFSQVREDPALDEAMLEEYGPEARVFLIASGGDTAAALVAGGRVGHLQMVDFNPAQLALARVKLHLLAHASPLRRLAVLGHAPLDPDERAREVERILTAEGFAPGVFGPATLADGRGLDQAGRYEILFYHLRAQLKSHHAELAALFTLTDPDEQARRIAPGTPLDEALERAFQSVMRLENLVCLFGEEATRNARLSFARHFTERTRQALATLPARTNPFLAQMLLGTFVGDATYDWLGRSPPRLWPCIVAQCSSAIEALAGAAPNSFDFVHLSNILDWLSPDAAATTLSLAWRALRPGGRTLIRQLNSTLDIPAGEPRFAWQPEAAAWHRRDRSFFYRALFVGLKTA